MSDDPAPYDKAIEETAKAASNAVDLIREGGRAIGPAIGNIYGILIGDKVSAARARRLDEISRKAKQILKDRAIADDEIAELPEDIAIPLLEAAQGEPRDELQNLWARLLANAMDRHRTENVRPEFVDTVRQLQPIDAYILNAANALPVGVHLASHDVLNGADERLYRLTAVRLSFARLDGLNCVTTGSAGQLIQLNDYGRELMFALEP